MLISTSKLTGHSLEATDGAVGEVTSLLFDDQNWVVRYLTAKSIRWIGPEVLIAPEAVTEFDPRAARFSVDLSKEELRASPDVMRDAPVSKQRWEDLHRHFGWSMWWAMPGQALPVPTSKPDRAEAKRNPHLRSTSALTGCYLRARDGDLGHIEDFCVDTETWTIPWIVIDTRNWLPGRHVQVLPRHVQAIDWEERVVHVDLTKDELLAQPEFDPSAPLNPQLVAEVYDFHGRPLPTESVQK